VVYSDDKHDYFDLSPEEITELEKSTGTLGAKGGIGAQWARYCNWLWIALIGIFIAKKAAGNQRGPLHARDEMPSS
jgi:hypothetical protein